MSTEYEKEMFDFFTQPSNFETMMKVAERAEQIKKEMVQQFWQQVEIELKKDLENKEGDWKVGFSGSWNDRLNKLWVYKSAWCGDDGIPIVSIAFEYILVEYHPYIGLHIGFDNKGYDGSKLKADLKGLKLNKKYRSDSNNYWAIWQVLDFNQSDFDSLVRLIPDNRNGLIQNVAREAIELVDLVKDDIGGLIEKNTLPT